MAGSKRQHSQWQGRSSIAAALEVVIIIGAIRNVQAGGDAVGHVHGAQRVTHRHGVEKLHALLTMSGQRQTCAWRPGLRRHWEQRDAAPTPSCHESPAEEASEKYDIMSHDGITHQQSKLVCCALWQRICLPVVGACKGEQSMTCVQSMMTSGLKSVASNAAWEMKASHPAGALQRDGMPGAHRFQRPESTSPRRSLSPGFHSAARSPAAPAARAPALPATLAMAVHRS